jgi:peptidoglycan/LPS O-acetylase OafA/YrhL
MGKMTAQTLTLPHKNSFNLLRLVLAALVVCSHSFDAAGLLDPLRIPTHGQWTFGGVAVEAFFVLSGFLIAGSWERTTLRDYAERRARRLYPGFLVCAAFCLLVVGPLAVPGFRWPSPLAMLGNTLGLQITPGAVDLTNTNISVWSLQFELWCYAGLALAGGLGVFRNRSWCLLLFALAVVWNALPRLLVDSWPQGAEFWWGLPCVWAGRWPRLLAFFVAGMTAYAYREALPVSPRLAGLCALLLAGYAALGADLPSVAPLLWSYLVLCAGSLPVPAWAEFTRRTDLSYGLYLYGWPVQVLLFHALGRQSPAVNLLCVLPLALGCAWLSWRPVESRCLRRHLPCSSLANS